jgi:hypothetical protein
MPPPLRPPSRLFHASRAAERLTTFAPLSHFGTLAAARQRADSRVFLGAPRRTLYEVSLSVVAPLRVRDVAEVVHTWMKLVDLLYYTHGVITAAERNAVFSAAGPDAKDSSAGTSTLVEILQRHGIDSLVYRNQHENAGEDSWIVVAPSHVTVHAVRDLGALAPGVRRV